MQIHIFLIEKCSSYNIIQDQIQYLIFIIFAKYD